MGRAKRADKMILEICIVVLVLAVCQSVSMAEVYKVGDSQGWTSIAPHPNYHQWAASKTFHVGDVIIFQYNKDFQNVVRVSHVEYKSCNVKDPIATYNSGNDSITIRRAGHYFYLCSFPGHCEGGQKVEFRVSKPLPSPVSPSTSPSRAPSFHPIPSPAPGSAPGPTSNGSSSPSKLWLLLASFLFLAAFATGSLVPC